MGSSAAWQLSHYGQKLVLIEQQGPNTRPVQAMENHVSKVLGPDMIFFFHSQQAVSEANLISRLRKWGLLLHGKIYTLLIRLPYIFDETGTEEIKALCHPKQNDYYKVATGKKYRSIGMNIPDSNTVIREYQDYTGMIKPKVLISKLHKGIKHYNNEILFSQTIISISQKRLSTRLKQSTSTHNKTGKRFRQKN
jgi:hypothetical protein